MAKGFAQRLGGEGRSGKERRGCEGSGEGVRGGRGIRGSGGIRSSGSGRDGGCWGGSRHGGGVVIWRGGSNTPNK